MRACGGLWPQADEIAAVAGDVHLGTAELNEPVLAHLIELPEFRVQVPNAAAMPRANCIEIDAEITHQSFDDFGAEPVIGAQRHAACDRQFASRKVFPPVRDPRLVLHIALRQPADG